MDTEEVRSFVIVVKELTLSGYELEFELTIVRDPLLTLDWFPDRGWRIWTDMDDKMQDTYYSSLDEALEVLAKVLNDKS